MKKITFQEALKESVKYFKGDDNLEKFFKLKEKGMSRQHLYG